MNRHIDVYNTHIEVYPYHKDDIPYLEDMYTATDRFTNKQFACGYLIDNEKLYLPRGTSISKIENILDTKANYIEEDDPVEIMSRNHSSLYDPRNKIQEESIKFLKGEGKQLALNLKTGFGKLNPVSMFIPTPNGWKRFGDLNIGDIIYSLNGETTRVAAIFPQGIQDIYRITLFDGRYIDCGLDHLSSVRISLEDDLSLRHTVLKTSEIISKMEEGCKVYLPAFKNWVSYPDEYNSDNFNECEWRRIKSIELDRSEESMCIKVDHPSRLYVVDQFILTHNTFCVAYTSTELNDKVLIITPNESLKQQWIKTYNTMFDYQSKHLMNIAGSNIIEGIMDDSIDIDDTDVFFVNHQTLRSYMSQTNGYQFHNFFKKLNIGIKVYDESHMEFGNILLIDFFSNTKRTWYLTATFDRSDKTESACFKRAFQSVEAYGDEESAEAVRKHVIYHTININSRIEPQQKAKLLGFPGFNSNKYGVYSIFEDKNKTLYKTILEILNKTKDVEGKTLIFVPLIDCVDEIVKDLKKDFIEKTVAAYHSKIPKDEKEIAEKKDIIVSTIKSCGTGRDIKGLRVIICAEPVVSKVVTEQMIGRLRPYSPDKDTLFFDIVDRSIPMITYWHKARFRKIETLVKDVVTLDMY